MTTPRNRPVPAVARARRGYLLLAHRHGSDAATLLPDPGGRLAAAVSLCAARDRRREEERR